MSEFRLRTLANFYTAAEARVLQSALEMQGIACTMNNAETVDNLWHLGNAVGGISVQIAEQDWEAAQAVMQAAPGGEPWVCPACGATVDAGFDLCWRCSADPHLLEVGPADESDSESDGRASTSVAARPVAEPVAEPESDLLPSKFTPTVNDTTLENLSRAWKCAVLCFGGVGNVYSLLLLTQIRYADLPQAVRWKFVTALLIDVFVLFTLYALAVNF